MQNIKEKMTKNILHFPEFHLNRNLPMQCEIQTAALDKISGDIKNEK
jgi:hypothetical protein